MEKETGTTRHIDYIKQGFNLVMGGPKSLLKELSTHAEFNEKSMCLSFINKETNVLENVWWFQGGLSLPQEWLTKKMTDATVCIMFCNLEAQSDTLRAIAAVMCKDIPDDKHPFWLDALVIDVNKDRLYSLMCDDDSGDHCETCGKSLKDTISDDPIVVRTPPEYTPNSTSSVDEMLKQLKEKYKEEN